MLCVLIALALVVLPVQGLEVVFEKIEQMSGFDVYGSTVRVRKYNRTTTAMNGTFTVLMDINDSFVAHTDFYHSPLGNQQFNHYPMKLPSKGVCEFLYSVYDDYYEYISDIVNLPEKGECPIKPREAHILDKLFPSKAIPPVLPKGLWKAIITTKVGEVEVTRFELTVKAYDNKFF